MADVAKLVDDVKGLSSEEKNQVLIEVFKGFNVLELKDFKDLWCDTFDVSAAAPVAAFGGPMPTDDTGGAEEPTEFDVILTGPGDKKIAVIKAVRSITGLGLKEAKELVDSAPKPIKEKVSKEEADKLKEELEGAGGSVEIKGVG